MRNISEYRGLSDTEFMGTLLEQWSDEVEDNNGKYYITKKGVDNYIFSDNDGFSKKLTKEMWNTINREFALSSINKIFGKSAFINNLRRGR